MSKNNQESILRSSNATEILENKTTLHVESPEALEKRRDLQEEVEVEGKLVNGAKKATDKLRKNRKIDSNIRDLLADKIEAYLIEESNPKYPAEIQFKWMKYVAETAESQMVRASDLMPLTPTYIQTYIQRANNPGVGHRSNVQGSSKRFDAWLLRNRPSDFMKIFGGMPSL